MDYNDYCHHRQWKQVEIRKNISWKEKATSANIKNNVVIIFCQSWNAEKLENSRGELNYCSFFFSNICIVKNVTENETKMSSSFNQRRVETLYALNFLGIKVIIWKKLKFLMGRDSGTCGLLGFPCFSINIFTTTSHVCRYRLLVHRQKRIDFPNLFFRKNQEFENKIQAFVFRPTRKSELLLFVLVYEIHYKTRKKTLKNKQTS